MKWVGRKASLASNMIQSFRMVGHHPYATLEENAILCFGFKKTGYYSFKREDPVVGIKFYFGCFDVFHFGQLLRSLTCNLLQPYNQLWCTQIEGVPPPWANYLAYTKSLTIPNIKWYEVKCV